jgi:hypothetical protein
MGARHPFAHRKTGGGEDDNPPPILRKSQAAMEALWRFGPETCVTERRSRGGATPGGRSGRRLARGDAARRR